MPTETPHQTLGVGGEFQQLVGAAIVSAESISPTRQLHHVSATATISTIVPPWPDFMGPIWLVADDTWNWDTDGNIATDASSSIAIVGNAYGFIYDRVSAKWYPISGVLTAGS